MTFNRSQLFHTPSDFFSLGGSGAMKLSAKAAYDLCKEASDRDFLIIRIEGGIWSPRGFEARLDCIWDGMLPPVTRKQARKNNIRAAELVHEESTMVRQDSAPYNAFIFTVCPISELS